MANDRTEKATPKRRQDARQKGQVARRPELPATAGLLAALLMMRAIGDNLFSSASQLFLSSFKGVTASEPLTIPIVHHLLMDAVTSLALLSLPVVSASLVASIVSNFAQGGLTLTAHALKPKVERFNPVANLKRVAGSQGPVELLKSIIKLLGIGAVCYGVLRQAVEDAPTLVGIPATQVLISLGKIVYDITLRAGCVLLLVTVLDYAYGWYLHEKSLRMTKQEIRDEFRQQEGDPHVKAQRRRAARALTQRRIMTEVPRADLVITNPTHFAVALRYDKTQDAAPRVVAKGADMMAKRIREIARKNEVPVIENPPLARSLYRSVEAGRTIPIEFFRAIAELLAYVYKQRERVL
jgi:flagellar biosynthesis protein FlhB